MDSCKFYGGIPKLIFLDWFAAGKGPNPVVAALDKDMDNYFKDRASKAEEPAADNKA